MRIRGKSLCGTSRSVFTLAKTKIIFKVRYILLEGVQLLYSANSENLAH